MRREKKNASFPSLCALLTTETFRGTEMQYSRYIMENGGPIFLAHGHYCLYGPPTADTLTMILFIWTIQPSNRWTEQSLYIYSKTTTVQSNHEKIWRNITSKQVDKQPSKTKLCNACPVLYVPRGEPLSQHDGKKKWSEWFIFLRGDYGPYLTYFTFFYVTKKGKSPSSCTRDTFHTRGPISGFFFFVFSSTE